MRKILVAALLSLLPLTAGGQSYYDGNLGIIAPGRRASGTLNGAGQTVVISAKGLSTVWCHEIPTGWTGTLTFEGTLDDATWFSVIAVRFDGVAVTTSANGALGNAPISVGGLSQFRVRVSAFTAGSNLVILVGAQDSAPRARQPTFSFTQDGLGNAIASAIAAPVGNERGLIVRNIPDGTYTIGGAGAFGSTFPAQGIAGGMRTSGNTMTYYQAVDADSGGGTDYHLGVTLRKIASGGSVEAGTAADPWRIDPTGTTTQPISGTVTIGTFPDNEPFNLAQLNAVALASPFDQDTGAGTQNLAGVSWRKAASGGSVEFGTSTDPVRTDPTGTTTQPTDPTDRDARILGRTKIHDGTDSALVSGTGSLQVTCDNCGGATPFEDEDAFTVGTSSVSNVGFLVDETTPDSAPENSAAAARMSANRNQYIQIRDAAGNERGVNVTAANALTVDGSAVTQPVSVAAAVTVQQTTASNLNAEVQGDAAHDAPVSGNPVFYGGYASAAAPADVSADGDMVRAWHLRNGAAVFSLQGAGILASVRDFTNANPLDVAIVDASGNQITTFGGGTEYAEDTAHVSGDMMSMAGVVQKSADGALSTDLDRSLLQVDGSGFLKVNVKAGGGTGGTSSTFGAAFPGTGTAAGFNDGTNMQGGRIYDADGGGGTEYVIGCLLRASQPLGPSAEAGTSSAPLVVQGPTPDGNVATGDPVRIGGKDGSGNAQDIITDAAGELQIDVLTLPANALIDVNRFGGNPVVTGTGASGVGIPRVTVSNDSSVLVGGGDVDHDVANTIKTVQVGGHASPVDVAPAVVSANSDRVRAWHDRSGAQITRHRRIKESYIAVCRLAQASGRLDQTFTQVANTNKQWCTLHHTASATKELRLLRVDVMITAWSVATQGVLELRELSSATPPATGNPAITPRPMHIGTGAAEATVLYLPTTQGSEAAADGPLGHQAIDTGVMGAVSTVNPMVAARMFTLYNHSDIAEEMDPPTAPVATYGGWAVMLRTVGAPVTRMTVIWRFVEEIP